MPSCRDTRKITICTIGDWVYLGGNQMKSHKCCQHDIEWHLSCVTRTAFTVQRNMLGENTEFANRSPVTLWSKPFMRKGQVPRPTPELDCGTRTSLYQATGLGPRRKQRSPTTRRPLERSQRGFFPRANTSISPEPHALRPWPRSRLNNPISCGSAACQRAAR